MNRLVPEVQAAGGSSGSDSINSTTVTADPVAVISTHILAGLQVWIAAEAAATRTISCSHASVSSSSLMNQAPA
jgi:hypothetical protein